MLTFTFDTNCIVDVDLGREAAPAILELVSAFREGRCDVAFVAVSASEKQEGDYYLPTFDIFSTRLNELGLGDVSSILGMSYNDMSYIGHAIIVDENMLSRERQFHEALFPNTDFKASEYVARMRPTSDEQEMKYKKRWRNAWCDRQMIWAHEYHGRDVFVTSDKNFRRKLAGKDGFAHLKICTPFEAVAMW
ncbi:hypothetical protein J7426_15840 [Tropicibacter sp. R16_0]|uniref:hypothetical protein n=1 Tax=Tropicibacter sp. R16_0 TaxID=2821102 RepID=UPI001ADB1A33|nr:hypothetical protein [Tropicibacter sp. R16_0]MBO9451746.1 hypothetical protein [Tropicibacter sp. R16_0]